MDNLDVVASGEPMCPSSVSSGLFVLPVARPDWWSSGRSSGVSSAMVGGPVVSPRPVVSGSFECPVASAVVGPVASGKFD